MASQRLRHGGAQQPRPKACGYLITRAPELPNPQKLGPTVGTASVRPRDCVLVTFMFHVACYAKAGQKGYGLTGFSHTLSQKRTRISSS